MAAMTGQPWTAKKTALPDFPAPSSSCIHCLITPLTTPRIVTPTVRCPLPATACRTCHPCIHAMHVSPHLQSLPIGMPVEHCHHHPLPNACLPGIQCHSPLCTPCTHPPVIRPSCPFQWWSTDGGGRCHLRGLGWTWRMSVPVAVPEGCLLLNSHQLPDDDTSVLSSPRSASVSSRGRESCLVS